MKIINLITIVFISFIFISLHTHAQLNPEWVSYYGGDSTRIGVIKYDSINNCVYVGGYTAALSGIASTGAHQTVFGGSAAPYNTDGFLAKFDTSGQRIWATYYGGNGRDEISSIALDSTGNIYICGYTSSTNNIASTGGFMPQRLSAHIFLAKFNPNGQRLWGTYYGSNSPPDSTYFTSGTSYPKLAIDTENNIYLAGCTSDAINIATPGSHQPHIVPNINPNDPPLDAFITKITPTGQRLWGTYYGGSGADYIMGICTDNNGDIYVTGISDSDTGIATPGVGVAFPIGYSSYGILAKFSKHGQRIWGAYIAHTNFLSSVAVDNALNIYVFGCSYSDSLISTSGTHQSVRAGQTDITIMKFNQQGQKLWGTYYGGSSYEGFVNLSRYNNNSVPGLGLVTPMQNTIAIQEQVNKTSIIISGATLSTDGINFNCSYEGRNSKKGFVASFDADTGTINWGTYYDALVGDLALDNTGKLYLAGYTPIDSIATPGSFLSTKPINKNVGLLGKFSICPEQNVALSLSTDTLFVNAGYDWYIWYKDGDPIGNSNTPYWVITASDTATSYHAVAVNNCKCYYTSNTITIQPTTIKNNNKSWQNLKVFPNPTNGAWVYIEGLPTTKTFYTINDLSGRTLINGYCNSKENSLDISALTPGVYLLNLKSEGSSFVVKITKK